MRISRFSMGMTFAAGLALTSWASAATVQVNDYSWLQLYDSDIAATIQGQPGGGSETGPGSPAYFRWGVPNWRPNNALTGSGTATYSATLEFLDQAREVETVTLDYRPAGASATKLHVLGSTDGTSFTEIGSHTFTGGAGGSNVSNLTVDVTDGTYQAIRVEFRAGEYTDNSNNDRGGPGLSAIEPYGDGAVAANQVNLANNPTFGTSLTFNGLDLTSQDVLHGAIRDARRDDSVGDSGDWEAGDYAQLDLTAAKDFNRVVLVWSSQDRSPTADFSYSIDGINFQSLTGVTATDLLPPSVARGGATQFDFTTIHAQYLRITGLTDVVQDTNAAFDELMVYNVPEPGTGALVLLGLGALVMLPRRRKDVASC